MGLSLLINTAVVQSTPTLAYTWNPVLTNLLVGVFLVVSIAMILLVLIQRPQGGGLSGAFGAGGGGGGAGQTAFGTKTGDVLTFATITIFILFLVFAIILNFATRPQTAPSGVPAITNPLNDQGAGMAPDMDEATEDAGAETDAGITDPAQAVDDAMATTPSVESGSTGSTGSEDPTPAEPTDPASTTSGDDT